MDAPELPRHVVLVVAPPKYDGEPLSRCLLAVHAVQVLATTLRQAEALLAALSIDLVVAIDDALTADAGLRAVLDQDPHPVVLVGQRCAASAPTVVTVMDHDAEAFEIALEVQRVARLIGDGFTHWGPLALDFRRRSATWNSLPLPLTPTQFKIMAVLVHARGAVVSRPELCRRAFGAHLSGDGERLDAHLRRIRRLIDWDRGGAHFLLTVRGEGMCLNEPALLEDAPEEPADCLDLDAPRIGA